MRVLQSPVVLGEHVEFPQRGVVRRRRLRLPEEITEGAQRNRGRDGQRDEQKLASRAVRDDAQIRVRGTPGGHGGLLRSSGNF